MDRNYRDALSQVTICMGDICTASMDNRVTETNRVAFSAPTDRRELCVSRNKRRRARLVGYVCPSQEKQNLFCLLQHLPFYVHFTLTDENTHSHELCSWKLHQVFLGDSFHFCYFSESCQHVCLSLMGQLGFESVFMYGFKVHFPSLATMSLPSHANTLALANW